MTNSRLTKKDWILAGFRALADRGPAALKAEPLARELGTTKGSFYWHFKDVPSFHADMLAYWKADALDDVVSALEAIASPVERLQRLTHMSAEFDPAYGGAAAEPAIRAWAQSDDTVADAVAEIDSQRLGFLARTLAEMGLTNPEFARILYGAYIGMGTLSAADGADNTSAMSTALAAILALQDA